MSLRGSDKGEQNNTHHNNSENSWYSLHLPIVAAG